MSAPTIYTEHSREFLVHLFAEKGCHHGAEIGVWEGSFSERLCRGNPELRLLCVDPWRTQPGYLEVKNNATRMEAAFAAAKERLKPYHCTFLRMTSIEAAENVRDGSLDFIYIDGNHMRDHVLADLKAWTPKVRTGGFIAGHDYKDYANKPFIQVKAAIDDYTREHGIDPWFVLANDKSPSWFWEVKR